MKQVLVLLLAIIVVIVGTNFYFDRQIEKQLELGAQLMQGMGGILNYSDVRVTFAGNVQIDNVGFMAPDMDDIVRFDRIEVRSGSLFGVQKLARDFSEKRIPEQLSVAFEGLHVPLGSEVYGRINAAKASPSDELALAGCGKRTGLSDKDYASMGYGSAVVMDTYIDLQIMNEGQWLELDIKAKAAEMYDMALKLDVSLNASSRDMIAVGAASANATLSEFIVDIVDNGFIRRLMAFCQKESGLERTEYLAKHLLAWQEVWKRNGFLAGDNMVAAYSQFLEKPEHLRIRIKPLNSFGFQDFGEISPELLPYQFNMILEVNDKAAGGLDLTVMSSSEQSAWNEAHGMLPIAAGSEVVEENSNPLTLAVADLRNHVNELVVLRLTSGRVVDGRILQADDEGLLLHSYYSGGTIEIPINYSQIEEAKRKPPSRER